MVRIGRRSRVVLQMTLWAVTGIALLTIPLLVSTNAHYPAPPAGPTGNTTGSTNIFTATPTTAGSLTKTPASTSSGSSLGDFLLRLSLILVTAVLLSSLMMVGIRKRLRRTLG